ncbi:MAG: hypothetical protein KIH08_07425 [Candidatus Freyarchaeota archaeon]|nr:hypothetical protein [Candidatus Jordarchaeia archaeon]MBS7269633.1 hypothetical protein [Candidatus Jordarchaeia archaeon]MBS7280418.1 hypothetical protein [Candidatus Jordarchaeia archaeon]
MMFGDSLEKKLELASDYTKFFRRMSSHFAGEEERVKDRMLEYLRQGRNPPAVLPVFWKRNVTAKKVYEGMAESMEIIKEELRHQSRMKELMKSSNVKLDSKGDVERLNKIFSGFVKDVEKQGDIMEKFLEQTRMDFLEPLIDVSKILDSQIRQQDKLTEKAVGSEISKELLGEFLADLKENDKEKYEEISKNLDKIEV